MKWTRKIIISMALASCLAGSSVCLITGCQKQSNVQKEKEVSSAGQSRVAVEENNIEKTSTVMAVGDKKISYSEVMFYVYYLQQQYKKGFGTELWDYQMDENTTMEDYVKDQMINEITSVKVISSEAEKAGYALTAEEENETKTKAANFLKTVSKEKQEQYGFSETRIQSIYREHALAEKMYDIVCGRVNTSISDEEAKQITVQVLAVLTQGEDRNGKKVVMDDSAKKIAKKRAQNFLKEGKKSGNFYSYADSNSDLGTIEYTFGKEDMPEEFGKVAFSLKTGQYSDVMEGTNGYYIIYCVSDFDEEKTTLKKEEMIEAEQVKLFQDTYKKWSSNYQTVVSKTLLNEIHMGA